MAEMENTQEKKEIQNTDKFPCKGCGGNMVYDPESSSLSCPYCGSKIEIAGQKGNIKEYDFEDAENKALENWGVETRVIKCGSCGAETVLEANKTAQFCAFCGSSHIVNNDKTVGIAPESLIPFKISEKSAKQSFKQWIGKRFFAPKAVKSEHQMQRLKGVYIPSWTYDSDTFSTYTGEGGTYYYVQETRWVEENGKQVAKTENVRKIRWWPTSGRYTRSFDDIPVPASKQIDRGLMERLEPFDRNELVHYKPEYLSGFFAERYSVGLKEGWAEACEVIDREINDGVVKQINADEVRNLDINTICSNIKFKLTLLPIWVSAFVYKNKTYTFLVNGQTGKVEGKYPLSAIKIILTVLLGLGIIGAVAYFMHARG